MISIVCVYNDEVLLEKNLVRGLISQNVPYQFIGLPNQSNRLFSSATSALNYGAEQATGKYIAFIHQDIYLPKPSWLCDTEKTLDGTPKLGVAGVAGITLDGRRLGHLMHRSYHWGKQLSKPEEVQTLDECVLLTPRKVFEGLGGFDEETFTDWHCYGSDYSLAVTTLGLKAYAVEAFVNHNTPSTNTNVFNFEKELDKLFEKWGGRFKVIRTICGDRG